VAKTGGRGYTETTLLQIMNPVVETLMNREALATALAERVAALAAEALARSGRFRIAIPGGSVIELLAEGLGEAAAGAASWDVFWVDERCVPPNHPDSNCGLAVRRLFERPALAGAALHPADGARGPEEAARAYEAEMKSGLDAAPDGWPRLDLVLLGLGEDGHVASLFPGQAALADSQRWVAPVRNAPKPPPERITLTLPVINHARHILVVAAGAGKAEALARALRPTGAQADVPAGRLRPVHGELRWLVDGAAAARLPGRAAEAACLTKEHP
jgi:6-phosphogluconolactonase